MFENSHQDPSIIILEKQDETDVENHSTGEALLAERYETELVQFTDNVYEFNSNNCEDSVSNKELPISEESETDREDLKSTHGESVTETIERLNEENNGEEVSDNRTEENETLRNQTNQSQPLTSKFIPKADNIPHNEPNDLNLLSDPFGYTSAYFCFGSNEENFLSLDFSQLEASGDAYNGEVLSKIMRKSFTNQSAIANESQNSRTGLGLLNMNQNVDTSAFKVRCLGGNEVVDHIRIGAYNMGIITRILSNNSSSPKTNCYISGSNERGQFGKPKSFKGSNALLKINYFEQNNLTLKDLAFGSYFTLFLTECGKVFSCGENENGQLGTNSVSNQYEIKQMLVIHPKTREEEFVTNIEAGAFHTAVKTASGNIYTNGYNCWGQCGSQQEGDVMLPTLIDKFGKEKIEIDQVVCIEHNTFFITKANPYSEIYACGFSKKGQLGYSTGEAIKDPVRMDFFTGKEMSVKSINGGWGHVCIVTNGGQVYSQGLNDYGQLGLGDLEARKTSTVIPFFDHLYKNCKLDKVEQVKCGSYHSLFLTRSGKLFGCGYNEMGSIALGNEHSWISVPTLIVQFPNYLIGEPYYQLEVKTWCYTTCILVKKRFKRIESMFEKLSTSFQDCFGDVLIVSTDHDLYLE